MSSEDPKTPHGEELSPSREVPEGVGYRKPPSTTRFKKGVSGNPKGRPKGSLNVATVLMKALRERVIANRNGHRKSVTKLEAALQQLVNKALSGDLRASRQLMELVRHAEDKQQVAGREAPVINQLDQQVMEDILRRFRLIENDGTTQTEEDMETGESEDDRAENQPS
jgi:hypothetical protein